MNRWIYNTRIPNYSSDTCPMPLQHVIIIIRRIRRLSGARANNIHHNIRAYILSSLTVIVYALRIIIIILLNYRRLVSNRFHSFDVLLLRYDGRPLGFATPRSIAPHRSRVCAGRRTYIIYRALHPSARRRTCTHHYKGVPAVYTCSMRFVCSMMRLQIPQRSLWKHDRGQLRPFE